MGRKKLDITKSIYIRFRVEPKLGKKFFALCKKNKIVPSKKLRLFVENECNNK